MCTTCLSYTRQSYNLPFCKHQRRVTPPGDETCRNEVRVPALLGRLRRRQHSTGWALSTHADARLAGLCTKQGTVGEPGLHSASPAAASAAATEVRVRKQGARWTSRPRLHPSTPRRTAAPSQTPAAQPSWWQATAAAAAAPPLLASAAWATRCGGRTRYACVSRRPAWPATLPAGSRTEAVLGARQQELATPRSAGLHLRGAVGPAAGRTRGRCGAARNLSVHSSRFTDRKWRVAAASVVLYCQLTEC